MQINNLCKCVGYLLIWKLPVWSCRLWLGLAVYFWDTEESLSCDQGTTILQSCETEISRNTKIFISWLQSHSEQQWWTLSTWTPSVTIPFLHSFVCCLLASCSSACLHILLSKSSLPVYSCSKRPSYSKSLSSISKFESTAMSHNASTVVAISKQTSQPGEWMLAASDDIISSGLQVSRSVLSIYRFRVAITEYFWLKWE